MKKRVLVLLFLLLLAGCGAPAEPEEPAPEMEFLPALDPLYELSTPAVVTEGRAQGDYELPQKMFYDPVTEDDFPVLLVELADGRFLWPWLGRRPYPLGGQCGGV